jgi:hypothetical protein
MAELITVNGRQVIDYMARDFASFRQALVERIPEKLPNWTDRSAADFGIVLIELFAHIADILSYYQDRIANESFLATAQERRSVIQHLRLIGYELVPASAASALLTLSFTVDNNRTDKIEIRRGDQFGTKSTKDRPSVQFEYANRTPLVIDLGRLDENTSGTGRKKFKSGRKLKDGTILPFIPVQEGRLVENELLGVSDGKPNQRFTLARPRMIRGSLDLRVEEAGLLEPWNLRKTLVYSRAADQDFTLQTDENDLTSLIFGDGIYGRIPPLNARIVATYRTGGGRLGNVAADTIKTILKAPDLLAVGASVTNAEPATGGEERESIEQAIKFAPLAFKSNERAVTVEDYVALARQFPGVAKARAEAANWNKVRLFIAPTGGGTVNPKKKVVNDFMQSELLAFFEDKRMLTTQIEILDPDLIEIFVTAQVTVKPFAFKSEVEAEVVKAVQGILAFDVVDFKAILYLSKFYEAIEAIAGIESVFIPEFRHRDTDAALPSDGRIALGENQIPVPGYPNFVKVEIEGGLE